MKVKVDIDKMIEKIEYLMLINMEDALTEENKTLKNLEIGYALEYFQTASWLKELKEIKKGGENLNDGDIPPLMTNAELFEKTFHRFATDIWALPENNFLEWLEAKTENKEG